MKDEVVDDSWMSSFISRQLRLAQMFISKKKKLEGHDEISFPTYQNI